jgi:hypothetical protein
MQDPGPRLTLPSFGTVSRSAPRSRRSRTFCSGTLTTCAIVDLIAVADAEVKGLCAEEGIHGYDPLSEDRMARPVGAPWRSG